MNKKECLIEEKFLTLHEITYRNDKPYGRDTVFILAKGLKDGLDEFFEEGCDIKRVRRCTNILYTKEALRELGK